jgi:hypothetical protein
LDLGLADLKLSYEGDDTPLSWMDAAIEKVLLRPTLSRLLMAPLASLPLSYLPDSLPLRLKEKHNTVTTEGLTLASSVVSLDSHTECLTLALRCEDSDPAPTCPVNLLSEATTANTAVALSETGLNRMFEWLCARDLAAGATQLGNGSVSWRWRRATAGFTDDGSIRVTGHLAQGARTIVVDTALRCSLTSSAQLFVRLGTREPMTADTDLILEAAAALIVRIFYAATNTPRSARSTRTATDSTEKLRQRFLIPGTHSSVQATAVDLMLRNGYLVASYDVPVSEQYLTLTVEEEKPQPTIVQPVIPHQRAPGAPVTTQIQATLANSAEPPYDYAWQVDHKPRPGSHRSPTITVTNTPPPTTALGTAATMPQKLATVSLKVIDILGQVGKAELGATYYPAPSPQQSQPEKKQPQPKKQLSASKSTSGGWGIFLLFGAALFFTKVILPQIDHAPAYGGGGGGIATQYTLNIYISDPNATVSTNGLTCAQQRCHWPITTGTLTLTANETGSIPTNWVGCDNSTSGPNDPCTISLNQNKSVCLVSYDPYQPNLVSSDRCRELAGG